MNVLEIFLKQLRKTTNIDYAAEFEQFHQYNFAHAILLSVSLNSNNELN